MLISLRITIDFILKRLYFLFVQTAVVYCIFKNMYKKVPFTGLNQYKQIDRFYWEISFIAITDFCCLLHIQEYLHLQLTFLRWTIIRPTGFIHRWRSMDRATSSLSDVTNKQTSWLVNVTFDWRQVMMTAVQRYGRTCRLITFLRLVFCTINFESSQLIHRHDLKINCKYKS